MAISELRSPSRIPQTLTSPHARTRGDGILHALSSPAQGHFVDDERKLLTRKYLRNSPVRKISLDTVVV